jgi:hypothetical protein
MINKGMMVLQNSEKVVCSLCDDTCPTSHDANHTTNIKAEEVSDAEGEGTSVPTAFVKIKTEPPEQIPNTEVEESLMPIPFQKIKYEPTKEDAEVEESLMPIPFQKIKAEPAEEVSDAEEEKVIVSTAFMKIKAEPEVSCNVSVASTVSQVPHICGSPNCLSYLHLSVFTHETVLLR